MAEKHFTQAELFQQPKRRGGHPRAFTPEQAAILASEHAAGVSANELARRHSSTATTICATIRRAGGKVDGHADYRRIFTDEEERLIRWEYECGATADAIGERLGYSSVTVRGIIRRAGGAIRPKRRYALNEDAFAGTLSHDGKYFVGLLLADGNIFPDHGTTRIALSLKANDRFAIEEFRQFLGCSNPIYDDSKGRSCFCVYSSKMTADLAHYGVVPRKSLIAAVVPEMAQDRDFWRGMVDGDGCLAYCRTQPELYLCGTQQVCETFWDFVRNVTQTRSMPRPDAPIWRVTFYSRHAVAAAKLLYKNARIALPRKAILAEGFANQLSYKRVTSCK